MQLLNDRGDVEVAGAFTRHYRRMERLLAAELGVRPRPEIRELYERMKE